MEIDIIEPGYYYHIYNRGINHEVIFPKDEYFYKFLSQYRNYMPQVIDTLAYCLLPTHFHSLIFIKEHPVGVPSNQFNCFFNSYAQWYNKRKNRYGGLFQRPFKRKRILEQDYLRQVIYYIHRNPMHHKYVEDPTQYFYSSYNSIVNEIPTWIEKDYILDLFETKANFINFHQRSFEIDRSLLLES